MTPTSASKCAGRLRRTIRCSRPRTAGPRLRWFVAIQYGAYDFVEKPVQMTVLKVILQRAAYLYRLERENRVLQERTGAAGFDEIIGISAPMHRIFEMIRRVAD